MTSEVGAAEVGAAEIQRLRWQCRRGMLELDLLLNRFLDQGYAQLSEEARADFVRMLGEQDQSLFDWLMNQVEPPESAYASLVKRIRDAALP